MGFLASALTLAGCARGAGTEADAGRAPGADASIPQIDAAMVDASDEEDAGGGDDAGPIEADASIGGEDAGRAMLDAGTDAGSSDAGVDGGRDAGPPAHDAGTDAGSSDAGVDGGRDAGPLDRCVGVSCSALDSACRVGVCNPATGACSAEPRPNGTNCDDGNRCTVGDMCSAGSCMAGGAPDCTSLDGPCTRGTCSLATGACVATPVTDGTPCDPDANDCVAQSCRGGTCSAAPANDCSACSSGGTVCAAGACSAPPTALSYGFETGLPSGWTVSGNAGWVVDATRAAAGTMSAHSGAIGHNNTSVMSATFDLATSSLVAFQFFTSTEDGRDKLVVQVDGATQLEWSGVTTQWMQGAVVVPAGTHTVSWRYQKDVSLIAGNDRVWIDEVRVEHLQPTTDFEAGVMPASFLNDGGWIVDTSSANGGTGYAAHSPALDNFESSSLQRLVHLDAAGEVAFSYRVSSEATYDFFEFYVDGTRQNQWSGEVAWTRATFPLAAGQHVLEWRYVKDNSAGHGMDRAWIDDISTGETSSSGAICGG